MPVTFVAATASETENPSGGGTPTFSWTLTIPAAVQAGDKMFVFCHIYDQVSPSLSTPTGWTLEPNGSEAAGWVFSRTATSADAGATLTLSGNSGGYPFAATAVLCAYRGVSSYTVAVNTTGTANSSTSWAAPSAVLPAGGIVCCWWAAAVPFTLPSGYTQRDTVSGSSVTTYAAAGDSSTTAPGSASSGSSEQDWWAATVALSGTNLLTMII